MPSMPFQVLTSLSAVDTSLSRVHSTLLPDQVLMELLIAQAKPSRKAHCTGGDGNFLDVCDWAGVTCSEDGLVLRIDFDRAYSGSFALDFIPCSARYVKIHSILSVTDRITGTLDTAKLPACLEYLNLQFNKFNKAVDLPGMPASVTYFDISSNVFTGSCDFIGLPAKLDILKLDLNYFSGSVSLDCLPVTLRALILNSNEFSGSVSLKSLPASLEVLKIHENAFAGAFEAAGLPARLRHICAECNCFSGTAIVSLATEVVVGLSETNVSDVIDERGKPHAKADVILGRRFAW